jgi:signal transduction histidine kinase
MQQIDTHSIFQTASKEFIEKNGGTLTVESEVNRGSRFIVSLPNA